MVLLTYYHHHHRYYYYYFCSPCNKSVKYYGLQYYRKISEREVFTSNVNIRPHGFCQIFGELPRVII